MPEPTSASDAPLENLRVLVLASPQTSGKLTSRLVSWGARIMPFRAVEIRKLLDPETLGPVLDRLSEYAWIVFTSSYGVLFFLEHLADQGVSKDKIRQAKVCAVGPATARTAMEHGLRVDMVPRDFVAEGLVKAFIEQPGGLGAVRGSRILIPRAKEARDLLPAALTASGAMVDILACYETTKAEVSNEAVENLFAQPPDLTVITSSSNVENFLALAGRERGLEILRRSVVAVLGPITASALERCGKKPDIIPQENTVPSLEQAIRTFYTGRRIARPN